MTSGKQARRQRQAQVARPPVRSTEGRRASPAVLLTALVGVLGIAVAVLLVVVFAGGNSGSSSASGTTLPDADVIAQQFEVQVMPTVISRYVRPGKVRVDARLLAFIGPDSERGRDASIAAGEQRKLFNYTQLLYLNQGPENSGWLDDDMVTSAAASIPGMDVPKLLDDRNSSAVDAAASRFDDQAAADNVRQTPTILIGRTGATPRAVSAADIQTLSSAIEAALP